MNTTKELILALNTAQNILINVDTRTDFDALCSSLVLSNYLEKISKKPTLIHSKKITPNFKEWLDTSRIKEETDISSIELSQYDLIVFLDSGDEKHVSLNPEFIIPTNIKTIDIDHHVSNIGYANLNYVKLYGSCTSVLFEIFKTEGIELSEEDLKLMLIGLMTDTGFFRYDGTKPEDFQMVTEIYSRGINVPDYLTKFSTYLESLDQVKFKQLLFKNLKVIPEKRLAYTTYTIEELSEIDLGKVIVNAADVIKYIKDIDIVFSIIESNEQMHHYKVSTRTKEKGLDLNAFSTTMGGGGHPSASGFKLTEPKTMQEAVDTVIAKLTNYYSL